MYSLYIFGISCILRVRLVRELRGEGREGVLTEERGGEGRDFNGGEGRGDILIKNVFGSQGEGKGRNFKIILLFYP